MSDIAAREAARKRRSGLVFNRPDTHPDSADNVINGESTMAKITEKEERMPRHKRMAMGEKIELKKGGKVKKHEDEAEDKKLIKKMVKKEDLKMAKGGKACAMKKGGHVEKKIHIEIKAKKKK